MIVKSIIKNLGRIVAVLSAILTLQACGLLDENDSTAATSHLSKPYALKINEGFNNPLGFYDPKPNFSWQLSADNNTLAQTKYQIVSASQPDLLPSQADLWDSGVVTSAQSTFVDYQGKTLSSRQQAYWQVRYWDEQGEVSSWSDVAHFELGLLSNKDWSAKWIEIKQTAPVKLSNYGTPIHIPQHLRTEFELKTANSSTSANNTNIKKARLYITAKGVFEAFINGQRIGDDILTPGYTPYKKRIETLTYDVTAQLQDGKNAFGIQLAEGWYAGRFGPKRHWHKKLNLSPKVLAQLEIEYNDGSKQIVATDNSWQATQNGPIRTSGLYDGERYDAHYELFDQNVSWHQAGYNASNWSNVTTSALEPQVLLQPKRHYTSKNKQLLPALAIKQVGGKTVFDLGQNMVGVPKIRVPMKKGQTLNLRFGEGVNPDGSLFTKNLGSAKQLDFYTAKTGGVIEWQPQFTFHGFRYVELSGFDATVKPELSWVTGVVQYTDFDINGKFTTSHPELNQFQSNIEWGLKGNFLDIPTDCPQRAERLGWTGDALAFANTSLFIADSHAFWSAWLQSIREEQFDDNSIPVVVPNEVGEIAQAGWSDAAVTIPWDVYWRTGDKKILAENYEMMTRWILYHQTQLKDGISEMWTVGDWLQPYSKREDSRRGETDNSLISTAFYARSVEFTLNSAKVLGKIDDVKKYSKLLAEIKAKFQQHFFADNGRLQVGEQAQTAYLLAIGFDLLDAEMTQKAVPHLLATFEAANGHLRTGFLGTPLLAPVLDKIDRADIAFDLVFKQSYPSWLFSVTQGATTVWERWDGYTHDKGYAKKAGSLNHYAYGAIGQWLYDRVAGISPLSAGYKTISIAPLISTHLTSAEGEYKSPYGEIKSKWQKTDSGLILEVIIPANTTARIQIPLIEHTSLAKKSLLNQKENTAALFGQKVLVNGEILNDEDLVGQDKKSKTITVDAGSYIIEVK
ncbi:glycoside hydrolase family 78 protein [Pseudoalteromonas mariniglutinosa]|uniref:glycoside hydrolase family 78 protein n=1 Tax=Pseudoalteromonas mariniglutinosa TaxID=206042 RepID=UPI0007E5ACF0|nr:glycoside hydrolase family 78 protein [Pseudoalteromonas mariniglutinosa]